MDENRLAELRAEAKHHRARLELYLAKRYSGRETSDATVRELELRAQAAEERLQAALSDANQAAHD